jgi:hypothetical protein
MVKPLVGQLDIPQTSHEHTHLPFNFDMQDSEGLQTFGAMPQ